MTGFTSYTAKGLSMTNNSIDDRQSNEQGLGESLSAMVDDQASELELRRLLKQSESDLGLHQKWSRYHMVGAVMRGESIPKETNLLAGIQTALDQEEPLSKSGGGFWSGAGRFAIAASVAGAIVIGAQQNWQGQIGLTEDAQIAGNTQAPVISPQSIVRQPVLNAAYGPSAATPQRNERRAMGNRANPVFVPKHSVSVAGDKRKSMSEEELQQMLNTLMLEHANNAATNSGRGVLPYARIPKIED